MGRRLAYYFSLTGEEKRVFVFIFLSLIAGLILGKINGGIQADLDIKGGNEARVEKIDVNRASLHELVKLPGIGPVLARRIVEKRREIGGFKRLEDLLKVKGVGKKKLEVLRRWLYVGEK